MSQHYSHRTAQKPIHRMDTITIQNIDHIAYWHHRWSYFIFGRKKRYYLALWCNSKVKWKTEITISSATCKCGVSQWINFINRCIVCGITTHWIRCFCLSIYFSSMNNWIYSSGKSIKLIIYESNREGFRCIPLSIALIAVANKWIKVAEIWMNYLVNICCYHRLFVTDDNESIKFALSSQVNAAWFD